MKGRVLNQSYDESLYTKRKIIKQIENTKLIPKL